MPFSDPNYTQTPNDLFDIHLHELGNAELRVVLAVIRQTFGYHREKFSMSISDMAEITGLSYNGVISGAEEAEKKGLIERITDGKKTTGWRAKTDGRPSASEGRKGRKPSASEGINPQPVRVKPSASEEGVDTKKEKKEEINRDDDNGKNLSPLSTAFVNASGIPELTGGPTKWIDALSKLSAAGVEVQDIEIAVSEMREKGYNIVCLSSIINPAITAMSKRKAPRQNQRPAAPVQRVAIPEGWRP